MCKFFFYFLIFNNIKGTQENFATLYISNQIEIFAHFIIEIGPTGLGINENNIKETAIKRAEKLELTITNEEEDLNIFIEDIKSKINFIKKVRKQVRSYHYFINFNKFEISQWYEDENNNFIPIKEVDNILQDKISMFNMFVSEWKEISTFFMVLHQRKEFQSIYHEDYSETLKKYDDGKKKLDFYSNLVQHNIGNQVLSVFDEDKNLKFFMKLDNYETIQSVCYFESLEIIDFIDEKFFNIPILSDTIIEKEVFFFFFIIFKKKVYIYNNIKKK
jgi:hypothetical protein